ncbi:TetR family transcriptional regulator [Aeromicrobium sp. A1-2]|uniref:TetR/AcrR family transcriptional regulator n=1 Tax=Aeromicrobium sp. A1-2 TaxID=2107713 RepID=UPI000E524810|nr:TetR/AcrR family transcriptional regulator [Aeromicrobium sp. A1-2]AXT86878.1 TetR family transcriptional regulator [Aeromicrobium sp. A1-2]
MVGGKGESFTAGDWTAAALDAIARGGLAAVAIEPLAKHLGTTKGSFYWHFADRNALVVAALASWEERDTELVIAAIERGDDPTERLRNLLELVFGAVQIGVQPGAGSVELALQANASDPLVSASLGRVTSRRLAYLTRLFAEAGMSPARARGRSLLAYTAFLGHAQLAHATPEALPVGRAFDTHVRHVVEALVRADD